MLNCWLTRFSVLGLILAFTVIILGAYTRITDAGLGCPDWPGCYGQLIAPSTEDAIAKANAAYTIPVEIGKARTEMTHRYFAESLGLVIVLFAALAFYKRRTLPLPIWLGPLLVLLVLAQGALGMWTVTLRLLPLVVMGHLLGGFCTLGLLWLCWLHLAFPALTIAPVPQSIKRLSIITLGFVLLQIALGGWTSANYAALICPDFPLCQGQWWPEVNFSRAINILGGLGLENPLSFMDTPSRTAIHMMHRMGAMVVLLLGSFLSYTLWQQKRILRYFGIGLMLLLLLQVGLGISNILFYLPVPVAVGHNFVAALLFLTFIALLFVLFHTPRTSVSGRQYV